MVVRVLLLLLGVFVVDVAAVCNLVFGVVCCCYCCLFACCFFCCALFVVCCMLSVVLCT